MGVFILSAAFAGLAGALNAVVVQVATFNGVSVHLSSEVILMVLLGGIGSTLGPLVGAGVLVSLQYFFASWELPIPVQSGLIFIAIVMEFPKGIVGEIHARFLVRRSQEAVFKAPKSKEARGAQSNELGASSMGNAS